MGEVVRLRSAHRKGAKFGVAHGLREEGKTLCTLEVWMYETEPAEQIECKLCLARVMVEGHAEGSK